MDFNISDADALLLQQSLANTTADSGMRYTLALRPRHLSPVGAYALAKGIQASGINVLEISGKPTHRTLPSCKCCTQKEFNYLRSTGFRCEWVLDISESHIDLYHKYKS